MNGSGRRPDLWDPGAQPERTALAWSRTTLALIVTGLLCIRLAPTWTGAAVASAVVCGSAGLLLHRARARLGARNGRLRAGRPVADPASVLLTTCLTVLLGAVGLAFALA
ncbi:MULTISPECIES: DUF202 domain-containing protein [Actinomadura]|uniref:DUF202 domain-containing protein n=1 Tax=Actinomadura yumaensis TaxID=111807 RepID=A0ABW2CD18_9ACTN|nr:DUF202 domain-containing protein [Actinomadura sp. J1-007]